METFFQKFQKFKRFKMLKKDLNCMLLKQWNKIKHVLRKENQY